MNASQNPPEDPQLHQNPQNDQEDDSIITTVFLWSLLVIVIIGIVVGGIIFFNQKKDDQPIIDSTPTLAPEKQTHVVEVPKVKFTDVTQSSGLNFIHENGATGQKFLPETMGGGCAFFDYDGDGDADILMVSGDHWPDQKASKSSKPAVALFENDGKGNFKDVSKSRGFTQSFYGMGIAIGDYNGDGSLDVFISALGKNYLYKNENGNFVDVSEQAGIQGSDEAWSTSSGFFDYDGDGDLDLFVCNYVRWSREIDLSVNFQLTGIGRAYGPPSNFSGTHCYLYQNNGDDTFTDVSAQSGIEVIGSTGKPVGKALGVVFFDADGDHRLDILVANDTVQNFFFHNQGNGKFKERGTEVGLAFDSNGQATGAMGIDSAQFRNDPSLGIGVGNFANEMSSLYVNQGERSLLLYTDEAITEGIGPASRLMLSFGLFFLDYDLDGRLDLFQTNGHLEEEINIVQPSQHYKQPAQLFWNAGPEAKYGFSPVDPKTMGDLAQAVVGRAAAYADIDTDGDLDILITQVGERPVLLKNEQNLGNAWIRIRLKESSKNTHAIGALIELTSEGMTQTRRISPTRSYMSQVEFPVTFGLGKNEKVDSLTVTWSDGSKKEVDLQAIQLKSTVVIEK